MKIDSVQDENKPQIKENMKKICMMLLSASSAFGVLLPLFAEVKYYILRNKKVSPFVDCRLGLISDFDDTVVLFSPSFGVDIDCFSVFAQLNSIGGTIIFSLGGAWNFR